MTISGSYNGAPFQVKGCRTEQIPFKNGFTFLKLENKNPMKSGFSGTWRQLSLPGGTVVPK